MKKDLSCLRCGNKMEFERTENIQLGNRRSFFGELSNLAAGALQVDIYVCPECRHIEFFLADKTNDYYEEELSDFDENELTDFNEEGLSDFDEENLPQRQCPECGKWHDFDYPKCPFCNYKYDF